MRGAPSRPRFRRVLELPPSMARVVPWIIPESPEASNTTPRTLSSPAAGHFRALTS
jgi:hypothetical protein